MKDVYYMSGRRRCTGTGDLDRICRGKLNSGAEENDP